MDTLWELLSSDGRGETTACRVGEGGRSYDYDRFITTSWQAGNYLRYVGVREDTVVGVVDRPVPETLFAAFGSGLLGGTTWFDPPLGADLRALVLPATDVERYEDIDVQLITYGGSVEDPSIERFEEGLWSENPTRPPEQPGGDTEVLTDGNRTYTQRELLDAASRFAENEGIDTETRVAIRRPIGEPGTLVGILGTISASGTLLLPDSGSEKTLGDVSLGEGPEPKVVATERLEPPTDT